MIDLMVSGVVFGFFLFSFAALSGMAAKKIFYTVVHIVR